MGLLGLRGETAIPLVLGNALNLYAGIAGILSLDLTVKEVFILATMLSFSHNIFIETGVCSSSWGEIMGCLSCSIWFSYYVCYYYQPCVAWWWRSS